MTYIEAITEIIGNLSTMTLPVRDVVNINRVNRALDILEAMKDAMEKSNQTASTPAQDEDTPTESEQKDKEV